MTHVIIAGDSLVSNSVNHNINDTLSESGQNTVWNVSNPDETSANMLKSLTQYIQDGNHFEPNTIVVLNVGQNELSQNSDVQTLRNLNSITYMLGELGVQTLISAEPNPNDLTKDFIESNPLYKQVCEVSSASRYSDCLSTLFEIKALHSDSTHLNSAGLDIFDTYLKHEISIMEGHGVPRYSNAQLYDFFNSAPMSQHQAFELASDFNINLAGFIHDYNYTWALM